jgi:DNA helicase-2/ATP-dependent DNA helicase PcrA
VLKSLLKNRTLINNQGCNLQLNKMVNKTEAEEKHYLKEVIHKLGSFLKLVSSRAQSQSRELLEQKQYIWENKTEKEAMLSSIALTTTSGEASVEKIRRLRKLIASPYFARIDFNQDTDHKCLPVYIGITSFYDGTAKANLIYDWRAPVSGMFYDFEPGSAHFEAPTGRVTGTVTLKRQYKIRNGSMEYMIDSSVPIQDELLQKELSKASDEKMRNIVATIQKEQNQIIRNEDAQVLIIQGVAGSGKTSIALHRIAFLLYRFKDTIASKNILIISPNNIFADYISNVLPELGEEVIPETSMEELAAHILENGFPFETFFDQVARLLEGKDESYAKRIHYKASSDFLRSLNEYIIYIEKAYFQPKDVEVGSHTVPASFLKQRFEAAHRIPLLKRFARIAKDVEAEAHFRYKYTLKASEKKALLRSITAMFKTASVLNLYKDFFQWLGQPGLLKILPASKMEYADVFPLVYLKIRLEGAQAYEQVRHLLIDEMQDYTPVQYAVLSRLFHCKKTIIGDTNQSVNPFSSSTATSIEKVFPAAVTMQLVKSYRSTYEITQFAQQISLNKDLIAIQRKGIPPAIQELHSPVEEEARIKLLLLAFQKSGSHSIAVICKTLTQAKELFLRLQSDFPMYLLTPESTRFASGIIITTAYLAKGLEFDEVIVPFATSINYHTDMDRNMLYVACTRAMHRLSVTYSGERTKLIN